MCAVLVVVGGFLIHARSLFRAILCVMCESGALPSLATDARIEMFQGDLRSVFFCIIDILAVVPESSRNGLSLDGDDAGPCGSSAYNIISQLTFEKCQLAEGNLTSSIRHDLEDRRMKLGFTALLYCNISG